MSPFRRKPAAGSKRPRPGLPLEALENRLTPAWFLMTSNLLNATSAPIAVAAPAGGFLEKTRRPDLSADHVVCWHGRTGSWP